METNNTFSRGSEWRKWDLHIHSPLSFLNNNFKNDWKGWKDALVKNKINAIGLTNYFRFNEIENVHEIDFIRDQLKDTDIIVFPNIEFRIAQPNKDGDFINIHILFSNKVTSKALSEFSTRLKLKKGNFCSDLISEKDFESALVADEILLECLNENFTRNEDFFIVCCPNGYGGFRSNDKVGRSVEVANYYDNLADFFFARPQDVEYFLNEKRYKDAKQKAVVYCSDAHSLDEIIADDKYSMIKAKTNFEGLKQIKYEPIERINLKDKEPDSKYGYNLIDYVQFEDSSDKLFSQNRIYFNQNLNAIIGGKSTGKSNLIKKIVKDVDFEEFKKKQASIDWLSQNITVKWISGNDEQKKILFIPQSYLLKDLEDGKQNIADIIETSLKGDKKRKQLYENLETEQKELKNTIDNLINTLFENGRIEKIKREELKGIGSHDGIKNEIEKVKQQKTDLLKELKIEEVEINSFNSYNEKINENEKRISRIEKDILLLNSKIEKLSSNSKSYEIISNEDFFNDEELQKEINQKYNENILSAFHSTITYIKEKITNIEKTDNQLKLQNDNIKKLIEPIQQKLNKQSFVNELTNKISELEKKFVQVEDLEKEITIKHDISKKIIAEVFEEFDKYFKVKEKFISEFSFNEDNLVIGYKLSFHKQTVYDWLRDNVVNNNTSYFSKIEKKQKEYIFNNDYKSFREIINFYFDEAINSRIPFKGEFNNISFIKSLLEDWFNIEPIMEYDGDKIEQMSDGKKAFVLLKLLVNIDDNKYPIILDQPEDSLDNRSIYNELTRYLKEKKKLRQIIIVTHNANLVVGADAENIIVANQHGIKNENEKAIKFDYINGALEDTKPFIKNSQEKIELKKRGIKEHVCEILEGGTDAFKKREEKYHLK